MWNYSSKYVRICAGFSSKCANLCWYLLIFLSSIADILHFQRGSTEHTPLLSPLHAETRVPPVSLRKAYLADRFLLKSFTRSSSSQFSLLNDIWHFASSKLPLLSVCTQKFQHLDSLSVLRFLPSPTFSRSPVNAIIFLRLFLFPSSSTTAQILGIPHFPPTWLIRYTPTGRTTYAYSQMALNFFPHHKSEQHFTSLPCNTLVKLVYLRLHSSSLLRE